VTSSAFRKIGYLLVGLAVALVAAAFAAPRLVDWDSYRSSFAALARQATGRHVVIAGDIRFSVFPTPTLTLGDVRVANVAGAIDPELIRARRVEIRLAPMALLAGRVEPRGMTVDGAVVTLEILANGHWNWSEAVRLALKADDEAHLASGIAELALKDATIIRRQEGGGTTEILSKVTAVVGRRAAAGAYRATGNLVARGINIEFDGSLGPFSTNAATPVKISLWREEQAVRLYFSGELDETADGSRLAGAIRGEGADLSALVAMVWGLDVRPAPALLSGDFTLEGHLSFIADRAELNGITVTLGDLRASGAGALHFGDVVQTELALSLQTVNIDRLLGAELSAPHGTVRASLPGLPRFSDGAEDLLVDLLEQSRNLPTSIAIAVSAIVYNGRLVRDLRVIADFVDGQATFSEMSASLPGGATIAVDGHLRTINGRPQFEGVVGARASNLRGLLEWLGANRLDASADRLRSVDLKGRVSATLDRLVISDARLNLDVSQIEGSFAASWAGRPTYRIDIAVDGIDLGAYRSSGFGTTLFALMEFDVDLNAKVGRLQVGGGKFVDAHVDGILQNGILTLRRFAFDDPDGIRASISGSLRQLIAAPVIDLSFELDTAAPALWSLVSRPAPVWSTRVGRIAAIGRLSGELADATLTADASVAGGRIKLGGGIRLSLTGPRYELDLAGQDLELWRILRVIVPGLSARGASGETLSWSAAIAGGLDEVAISDLAVTAAGMAATGVLSIDLRSNAPEVKGRIETGGLTVEQMLAAPLAIAGAAPSVGAEPGVDSSPSWTRTPIVGLSSRAVHAEIELVPDYLDFGAARIKQPRVGMDFGPAGFGISRLTGTLFGGRLSASARLGAQRSPQVQAVISLMGADLVDALPKFGEFETVSGRFDIALDLAATGGSLIEMASTLAGTGRIEAERVVLKGFDLTAVNNRVRDRARPVGTVGLLLAGRGEGLTRLVSVEGTVTAGGGRIRSNDLAAIADGGRLSAAAVLYLLRREIEATVQIDLAATPDAPPLLVKLAGPADSPDVVFEFDAFQDYLKRTAPPRQPEGGVR